MAEQLIATSTYTTEAVNDCPVSPTEAEYMSAKNNYISLRQKWEELTNKQKIASLVVGFASQAVSDLDEAGSTTEEVFSSLDEFSLTPLENELQDLEGYQSTIKGIITIKDGKVLDYEIKEQGDSFFSKVEERDYTKYLVDNQDKLDSIDTVSGATISSTAVLKMLVNTIDGYKNKNYLNFDGPKEEEKPRDFEILETNGNIYKVKQKSFGGDMILNITIIDNKVSNIELVSYNDTCVSESNKNEYYECPEYLENGYISSLIENNDIDTVSGATISSTALKNAIKNTLEAINEG